MKRDWISTDILVIGAGPAGLQAAIHAGRRKVDVLVAGKISSSSLHNAKVENYCCIEHIVEGKDLLKKGRKQAEKFGVKFIDEDILEVGKKDNGFLVETEENKKIMAKALIIATGAKKNRLAVAGEKEYEGRGVSYCAECDALFFNNKTVAVIGDGSAAVSGVLHLILYAKKVFLIYKQLNVSSHLKKQIDAAGIEKLAGQEVQVIEGEQGRVNRIILKSGKILDVDGVFILQGAKGVLDLFLPLGIELDKKYLQYILTNKSQETNQPGIFAAGDVCGPPFQLAKAVGEGCVAGLSAADYIVSLKKGG